MNPFCFSYSFHLAGGAQSRRRYLSFMEIMFRMLIDRGVNSINEIVFLFDFFILLLLNIIIIIIGNV